MLTMVLEPHPAAGADEMSKQAFTPGPWQYASKLTASENHRGFFVRAPNRHGMWALAEVLPGDEDGILGEANARLIAAAPELYEALRAVDMEARDADANGNVAIPSHVY